jgi:hypothetical protein
MTDMIALTTSQSQRPQPGDGEHLCFIWCDGKVDVVRLKSRAEAHTWHQAHAAVWHLVDTSRNAGSLMVPAKETWHDVIGKDGVPPYVAMYVRAYLDGKPVSTEYRNRALGIPIAVTRAVKAEIAAAKERRDGPFPQHYNANTALDNEPTP